MQEKAHHPPGGRNLGPLGNQYAPAVGALIMTLSTIIVAINAQTLRGLSFSVT